MNTLNDFKKKTHEEFDEKFGGLPYRQRDGSTNYSQRHELAKAFLDTTLDNLLVEVEGAHKDYLNEYFSKNAIARNITIGEDRYARDRFKEIITRFKGEDKV